VRYWEAIVITVHNCVAISLICEQTTADDRCAYSVSFGEKYGRPADCLSETDDIEIVAADRQMLSNQPPSKTVKAKNTTNVGLATRNNRVMSIYL
jgi:hypothetical protein